MVPQDQFNRMAFLALVAILLLLTFACRAYADEITFIDSGPSPQLPDWIDSGEPPGEETSQPGQEEASDELSEPDDPEPGEWELPENFLEFLVPETEGYQDSGEPLEPGTDGLLEEVTRIRQMLELILCFIFPFIFALWFVYKFCMWFYYTFIRMVL